MFSACTSPFVALYAELTLGTALFPTIALLCVLEHTSANVAS